MLSIFKPLYALLLGIGIIFGTFINFQYSIPFGFTWFVNLLWFSIGFPTLYAVGIFVWGALEVAEAKALKLED